MSRPYFARISAFVAVGTLLIAGGFARAESVGEYKPLAVVASSADDCDYGWHPIADGRYRSVARRVHGLKLLAHQKIGKPHPMSAAFRREQPSLVIADNMGYPVPASVRHLGAVPYCTGGITWNLLCPGAQVIGVTY
jgi:hypothetical protein